MFLLKGIIHRKMKTHSLPTRHYADGGVGEVLCAQNTFGVSGVNSIAAKSNTIEVNGDPPPPPPPQIENNVKCLHPAPVVSSKCPLAPTSTFESKGNHLNYVFGLNVLWSPRLELHSHKHTLHTSSRLRVHNVASLVQVALVLPVANILTPQNSMEAFSVFLHLKTSVDSYLNCIGFGCNRVYPWNSKSVLWTQTP